jgi:exopolyphosphatase / guanosine-5'-triphosphate,3'-diphosphate pyrophosphatase
MKKWSFTAQTRFRLFILVLSIVLITGCSSLSQKFCIEQRAAFDIGSATMKMKVANVDKCSQTVIRVIEQKEIKVPFAENTRQRLLNRDIRDKGLEQLSVLKKEALAHGVRSFAGVATAAFRQADNTPQFLAEINEKTGINIRTISQDEEAILGYKAAMTQAPSTLDNIVVWDIGGNSMQIIVKDKDPHYRIYRGHLASISFKNQLLEKIHHKTAWQKSPNPIGSRNLNAALDIATKAASEVPDELKSYIYQTGSTVIGIGGVHNQSIRKQIGKVTAYTQEDLMKAVKERVDWDDAQIGGPYADTNVSNLILVLGFMKELDIEEVQLVDVNLTDGILIDPSFWQ